MDIKDLTTRFSYKADSSLDTWRILSNPTGSLVGDCDDFAATALWAISGSMWSWWWSVITFRAVFWLCNTTAGVKHVVLHHSDYGWIDCIYPEWNPTCKHTQVVPFIAPIIAIKLLLGKLFG